MNRKSYGLNQNPNQKYSAVGQDASWDSGFSIFKRRIGEQLLLNGFSYDSIDDSDLLNFYRRGESETFVLGAVGCF